jgi:hypothetical protein
MVYWSYVKELLEVKWIMVRSVGVYVSEGTLREAADESRLQGASKSEIVRFALLRTVMSAREARTTIFGEPTDLHETAGRVDGRIPDHELEMVQNKYPHLSISEIGRYGFGLASNELPDIALEGAKVKRGPKPKAQVA